RRSGSRCDRTHSDHWRWTGARHLRGPIALGTPNPITLLVRRRGQVVRRQTANLLFVSSILTGASFKHPKPPQPSNPSATARGQITDGGLTTITPKEDRSTNFLVDSRGVCGHYLLIFS